MTTPQPVAPASAPRVLSAEQVAGYHRDGYLYPLRVLPVEEAAAMRAQLEAFEATHGLVMKSTVRTKPHLLFTWADRLIRHPAILDAVEDILGPDLLVWGSSFFIKEANDPAYVSWHQDSTYWGLSHPDIVTAWIALSVSDEPNGAMRVIPGSHAHDQLQHKDTFAADNLLTRGQEVAVSVDASAAVDLTLQPGEMSLHHVRIVHGSEPNRADYRRIGFAVRYVPTYVRQTAGPRDSAVLVRGTDRYHHFEIEPSPLTDFGDAERAVHHRVVVEANKILFRGTDRTPAADQK